MANDPAATATHKKPPQQKVKDFPVTEAELMQHRKYFRERYGKDFEPDVYPMVAILTDELKAYLNENTGKYVLLYFGAYSPNANDEDKKKYKKKWAADDPDHANDYKEINECPTLLMRLSDDIKNSASALATPAYDPYVICPPPRSGCK